MASSTSSSAPNQRPRRVARVIRTLSAALGLVLILLVVVVMFGRVYGEEFSPDSFARRRYSYFELPLVKIQVSPIRRRMRARGALEQHLLTQKWVAGGTPRASQRWDLVISNLNDQVAHVGDAQILCRYLDAHDTDNKLYWLAWSEEHPDRAAILWPEIAKTAEKQLYLFIPDLMTEAKRSASAEQLRTELDAVLSQQYLALGVTQAKLGKHDLAVVLFTEALAYDSGSRAALEARAEALQQLGRTDEARRDRDAANRLRSP